MPFRSGSHYLQLPGPTPVPDRVLRAMDRPVIDHRGPEFAELVGTVLPELQLLIGTTSPVILYPSSGTGAWEAAIVNVLNPGDRVLIAETGQFSTQWGEMARKLGLAVETIPGDWRHGVQPDAIRNRLAADTNHTIAAVMVVHNETSTGVTSNIRAVRAAIDDARHPALFLVDTVSSLATSPYEHDAWGVDVMVSGSQKGLMLPPGIGINATSPKAWLAHERSRFPRAYFDWSAIRALNASGFYPYTPPTLLFFGLREALRMLSEEGMANVYARHARLADATRRAVRAWGLEVNALVAEEQSSTLTAVVVPEGVDADAIRETIRERFDMSLGAGLGKVKGRVFRIGHLGNTNDLTIAAALCGVQMGLRLHGLAQGDGIGAALDFLQNTGRPLASV